MGKGFTAELHLEPISFILRHVLTKLFKLVSNSLCSPRKPQPATLLLKSLIARNMDLCYQAWL